MKYDKESGELAVSLTEWVMLARRGISTAQPIEEEVDNIEYREQDDPGRRVLGFGSSKLLLGEFENDEFGSYTRYSYTKCDSCVVLSVGDRILVINGENDESTKQIYDELTKRVDE